MLSERLKDDGRETDAKNSMLVSGSAFPSHPWPGSRVLSGKVAGT